MGSGGKEVEKQEKEGNFHFVLQLMLHSGPEYTNEQ